MFYFVVFYFQLWRVCCSIVQQLLLQKMCHINKLELELYLTEKSLET